MRRLTPLLLAATFATVFALRVNTAGQGPGSTVQRSKVPGSNGPSAPSVNDTIQTYCVDCHNDQMKKGELSLETFDVAKAADHAETAEKMIRKLRTGLMP